MWLNLLQQIFDTLYTFGQMHIFKNGFHVAAASFEVYGHIIITGHGQLPSLQKDKTFIAAPNCFPF